MPEFARISDAISSTTELTFEGKLHYVEDIQNLCSRHKDITYLPNEQPINGQCPAKGYRLSIKM